MRRILALFILTFLSIQTVKSQDSTKQSCGSFYADFAVGPYLMVDHIRYKSVFLKGARLGFEHKSGLSFGIEYLVGQQHDIQDQLGTTHSAMGMFQYFPIKNKAQRFRPYLLAGGGFFEFKDFSKDVLGVAFYGGGGILLRFSPQISGFIESRYVNLGPMNLEGKNELGVLWGVRASF